MGFFSKLLNVALFVANVNALRLMQYNVEWLFIDYYKSADCPGNGCSWHNESVAYDHLYQIGTIIDEVNPDIINVCEVEGINELNILQESLKKSDEYNSYLLKGTDTSTGQNVGMLTRVDPIRTLYRTDAKFNYPIPGSKCGYTDTGTTGVSKHYITEFNFNNMDVAFISAHFIAIPTEASRCAQREGQASVLQSVIADYISRDYEVIMMGDFNDFDGEVLDVNSNKPTSQVLNILKGQYGAYAGKYELVSVAETVQQSQRYSDWYDSDNNCNTQSSKDYSMIDHVLVTSGIQKNIADVTFYHKYPESCETYNSDHYPVIVDLYF